MDDQFKQNLRAKILHALKLYPRITPSMLQQCIGSTTPASLWQPVLDDLVREQEVTRYHIQSVFPNGRTITTPVISSPSRMRALYCAGTDGNPDAWEDPDPDIQVLID